MSAIRRNILAAALVGLSAAVLLTGCSGSTAAKPPTQTPVPFVGQQAATQTPASSSGPTANHVIITITDTSVSPASVTVKPGGRVVWQNNGKQSHIIAVKGGVTSPPIKAGSSASHVFEKDGTYTYTDPQTPAIQGTIVVQD